VRDLFVQALERTRMLYRMRVYAFVVMPEHVHLLISEPERGTVANAMQSLKISSAKRGRKALAVSDFCHSFPAKVLLRPQRVEPQGIHREAEVYSSQPREAGTGRAIGGLEMEQLSPLRRGEDCGVQIASWRSETYTFAIP